MRRLFTFLVAACATGAILLVAGGVAQASPVSQLFVAIGSNAVPQNPGWTAADEAAAAKLAAEYQTVILQPWETRELQALKSANPGLTVLMYQDASSASSDPSYSGLYSTGVSYTQAQAHGWVLRDTQGDEIQFSGYPWLYATDVGSTAYQNAWAANVISELQSGPWSGVFMDDVNPTISFHFTPVSAVAKYPSNGAYAAATGSFVDNVGPQLQAAGELAVANIGSWPQFTTTVDPWLSSLSGAMDEEFVDYGSPGNIGYQSETAWEAQLTEATVTRSQSKLFLAVTHSGTNNQAAAVYGYATALLAGGGGDPSYTASSDDYETADQLPQYGYPIGTPAAACTIYGDPGTPCTGNANGVRERAFTGGLVLVNPTSAAVTVSLNHSYSGSGKTAVKKVTMAPQTGLVLYAGN